MKGNVKKLVLSAMFTALGIVLPFFTGQIKEFGNMLLPMHLPVFLAGLICSWQWGAAVGFVLPLMRSAIFGMPLIYPSAIAMAFELSCYGLISGLVYSKMKHNLGGLYVSMLSAMLGGRIVWGIAQVILLGLNRNTFTFSAFITQGFINAVPGIVLQLVLIPAIMLLIRKTKLKA